MRNISFSWAGKENSEDGHGVFKCGEVLLLSLDFPSFSHAHFVNLAMEAAFERGEKFGRRSVKEAVLELGRSL